MVPDRLWASEHVQHKPKTGTDPITEPKPCSLWRPTAGLDRWFSPTGPKVCSLSDATTTITKDLWRMNVVVDAHSYGTRRIRNNDSWKWSTLWNFRLSFSYFTLDSFLKPYHLVPSVGTIKKPWFMTVVNELLLLSHQPTPTISDRWAEGNLLWGGKPVSLQVLAPTARQQ